MTTTRTTPFEELTRLASDFVAAQKGMWDHKAWMDFLSRVQQKGIEMSEEKQARLGDLLEAMKEYHIAVSSIENVEKAMSTVLNESVAFINRQQGVWGHSEWEDFLKTMQQNAHIWRRVVRGLWQRRCTAWSRCRCCSQRSCCCCWGSWRFYARIQIALPLAHHVAAARQVTAS